MFIPTCEPNTSGSAIVFDFGEDEDYAILFFPSDEAPCYATLHGADAFAWTSFADAMDYISARGNVLLVQ